MSVIVALAASLVVVSTRANRLEEVRSQLERLSTLLADRADRTFEVLDLVEQGVVAEFLPGNDVTPDAFVRHMSSPTVHQRLRDRMSGLPQVDTLAVMDAQANMVNSSGSWPAPQVSIADRDYFKALSQRGAPNIYISEPIQSHLTGAWSVVFARKVSSPDGDFLGVIVAAMNIQRVEKYFADIARGEGDAISMLRTDGVPLARFPPLGGAPDQKSAVLATLANMTGSGGFYRVTDPATGRDRFVATTRSVHYPLLINVSSTVAAAFMRLNRQTWFLVSAAVLLELCIFAVAILGSKELRGRLRLSQFEAEKGRLIAQAELALAREREAAAEQRSAIDRQFRVAIETMRQGLFMFDRHDTLVVYNRRVATDLGIPFDRLSPGLPLQSILDLLEEHGTIDADGAARLRHSLTALDSEPEAETIIETLLDGRILSYAVRAMSQDRGWVLTCEDVTYRHKAEQRLLHVSLHDPLTDLANRTALRNRVESEARRAHQQTGSAILYVDLDGFKEVNDSLGHPAGDAVLQTVAERLLASTRTGDTVARIGGDEFVIVQASSTQPASAAALAERLIEQMRVPFDVSGHHVALGASVGIAFIEPGHTEPDFFIKNADLALYEAKKDGGNCYRIFEPRLEIAAIAKSTLYAELKEAVANQDFVVHYQPLVCVPTRALCGFEALVRWRHPSRGLVAPGAFIHLAEEIGLISQLGKQVLFQACAEAASWPSFIKIAVNLSPKQFGTHPRIVTTVKDALAWSGLNPERLELEITESILLQGNEETVHTLYALKQLGVSISMDDFGTGYSSLSYLQKFPFDKLKIDQSFVRNMCDGGSDPIVHAIMELCKAIRLRTTAEGVETEAQFDQLRREGCDEAQGYLFGPATPATTIASVIERLTVPRYVAEASLAR